MSKYKILLIILAILFVFPQGVKAAASISLEKENLNPRETGSATVKDLIANTTYAWVVSKVTSRSWWGIGSYDWTAIQTDCINSDNSSQITGNLGPYLSPGVYRLEIFTPDKSSSACKPSGNSITSQQFSVGGFVDPPNGHDCCGASYAIYDINKKTCKRDPINNPLSPTVENECSRVWKSFCEPQSVKCFTTETSVHGKICKKEIDNEYKAHPELYAICGYSKGKETPGCTDDSNNPGIVTAIGCIHTNPTELVKNFLTFVIGIAGGLAFLLMLLGAFQMLTSAGNPETLNAGRERLTSAVIGLLFVIFAILLLQIIGVDILKLPGFGR